MLWTPDSDAKMTKKILLRQLETENIRGYIVVGKQFVRKVWRGILMVSAQSCGGDSLMKRLPLLCVLGKGCWGVREYLPNITCFRADYEPRGLVPRTCADTVHGTEVE